MHRRILISIGTVFVRAEGGAAVSTSVKGGSQDRAQTRPDALFGIDKLALSAYFESYSLSQ